MALVRHTLLSPHKVLRARKSVCFGKDRGGRYLVAGRSGMARRPVHRMSSIARTRLTPMDATNSLPLPPGADDLVGGLEYGKGGVEPPRSGLPR